MNTKLVVMRRRWTEYGPDCRPGSGYCKEHHDYHYLVRQYYLWGIKIWSREIDRESIPVFASVGVACFGYTDWRSKFKEHM